jgi:hypothetical protein
VTAVAGAGRAARGHARDRPTPGGGPRRAPERGPRCGAAATGCRTCLISPWSWTFMRAPFPAEIPASTARGRLPGAVPGTEEPAEGLVSTTDPARPRTQGERIGCSGVAPTIRVTPILLRAPPGSPASGHPPIRTIFGFLQGFTGRRLNNCCSLAAGPEPAFDSRAIDRPRFLSRIV